jgi:hypothetical protein
VADAVGGLLRLGGVEVDRESPPPPLVIPTAHALPSASPVNLAQARDLAAFPIRVPAELGEPQSVTVTDPDENGVSRAVALAYPNGVRLDQFDGTLDPGFAKVAPNAQSVQVDGRPAIWLPTPHPLTYVDRDGLRRIEGARPAGPTFVWAGEDATYRLEGIATLAQAQTIAGSLE